MLLRAVEDSAAAVAHSAAALAGSGAAVDFAVGNFAAVSEAGHFAVSAAVILARVSVLELGFTIPFGGRGTIPGIIPTRHAR